MLVHNLMQWMADTEWSVGLHESRYAYTIIESVHVWSLCLFVGFAVLFAQLLTNRLKPRENIGP